MGFIKMFQKMRNELSNWASYNICFSKAALFISGLVFSHSFVEKAFFSVLISFVTSSWETYHLPKAAAIVNAQEGVSILFALVIAYVADEWLGRFKVVGYTTAAFITGLVMLCFHTGSSGTFYMALLLVTVGKGGRSPTLEAFLRDQFSQNPNSETEELERAEARQQFWWRTAWFLGALFPIVTSSFLSLKQTVMISSIITGAASLAFLLGIRCYSKEPPRSNIRLQMNNPRSLLRLVPLWMMFLVYCLVESAGSTFFLEQSDYLEDGIGKGFRIPLTFFVVITSLTKFTTSQLVDFIITSKFWKENQARRAFVIRNAMGMVVSFLCCIAAWRVEVRRLKLINEYGVSDSEIERIPMNILWLTPQFVLLGFTGGLVEEGMRGSFYNLVPESMRLYELPFNKMVMGMGKIVSVVIIFVFREWFGETSGESQLDRYFLMLGVMSIGSLPFLTVFAYAFYWNYTAPQGQEDNLVEMEEGLAQGIAGSDEPLGDPSSETDNEATRGIEPLTRESSGQISEKGYLFSEGDSMATRPSPWNRVRESLRNRSFGPNSRSFN
ncbi:hypothetical protein F3Y22_tig00005294pilonHSYRG00057 [Hibiscus syriacus]|uniref:Protein NRT1/ PTR FAMILY 5.7 n=1 Tax=Hibiscus syriacus TaxID=106335 RepID=A0A6A3CL37_HIBSY|nr:protein NRT1/ PTR FAMILY 5.4-like [Hibiscus syriacus]KAE8727819.1 hypothetical protein F3Y22_tig00005294pilonHSYRG00057 [Hibiscus syriacus]